MSEDAASLLEAALQLPTEDRAAFADSLLASLEPIDDGVAAAWAEEIKARFAAIDAGEVQLIDHDEAMKAIAGR